MSLSVPLGGGGEAMWTADRRLCLTEDKDRLVSEDSPDARWLWCSPGSLVSLSEARRLGAVADEASPAAAAGTEPAAAGPRPAAAKRATTKDA